MYYVDHIHTSFSMGSSERPKKQEYVGEFGGEKKKVTERKNISC